MTTSQMRTTTCGPRQCSQGVQGRQSSSLCWCLKILLWQQAAAVPQLEANLMPFYGRVTSRPGSKSIPDFAKALPVGSQVLTQKRDLSPESML
jgi:hypothetical protein